VPRGERFRLGGMVTRVACTAPPGASKCARRRLHHDVPVNYTGVLPDLFAREPASSRTADAPRRHLVADEVLAKHDEKYMPPEGRAQLKKRHGDHGRTPRRRPHAIASFSGY